MVLIPNQVPYTTLMKNTFKTVLIFSYTYNVNKNSKAFIKKIYF